MQGAGAKTVRRSSLQGLGQKARLEAGGKVSEVLFPGAMGCINLSDRMASGDRAMLTPDRGSPRKRMQGGGRISSVHPDFMSGGWRMVVVI